MTNSSTPSTQNAHTIMNEELRQIILPIVMQHFSKYRGRDVNSRAIYECTDQLVEELCKKL